MGRPQPATTAIARAARSTSTRAAAACVRNAAVRASTEPTSTMAARMPTATESPAAIAPSIPHTELAAVWRWTLLFRALTAVLATAGFSRARPTARASGLRLLPALREVAAARSVATRSGLALRVHSIRRVNASAAELACVMPAAPWLEPRRMRLARTLAVAARRSSWNVSGSDLSRSTMLRLPPSKTAVLSLPMRRRELAPLPPMPAAFPLPPPPGALPKEATPLMRVSTDRKVTSKDAPSDWMRW